MFHGILHEEHSIFAFILATVLLGGGAAWMSGRAIASTWRPYWQVVTYMLVLGFAVRFMHHALFSGTLLSPWFYVVDTAVLIAAGSVAYFLTRAALMVRQYPWAYERAGLFGWRDKAAARDA